MRDDDFRDWRRDEDVGFRGDEQPGNPTNDAGDPAGSSGEESASVPSQPAAQARPRPVPIGVRAQPVVCPSCGYNLTGATIGQGCPECGAVVGAGLLGAVGMPTSGRAIASLVLAIVSILGCCMWGLPGVICGGLALTLARGVKAQVVAGEVHPSSQGLATAGQVCGWIGFGLGLVFVGLMVIGIVSDLMT